MGIQVRPITSEEYEPLVRATTAAFAAEFHPEEVDRVRIEFEPGRALAAWEGSEIVGSSVGVLFDLTVPGGVLPALAVTSVAVLPTHRRRGILTQLMRRQLEDAREAGTSLALLWASEAAIYPRFGYGLAVLAAVIDVDTRHAGYRRAIPVAGRFRMLPEKEALEAFVPVYERVRPGQPGFLSRDADWWSYRFWIPAHEREGMSENFYVLYEEDGRADGYVVYRTKHDWPEGTPEGVIEVQELVAATDSAYAALWRYCFDHDLMTRLKAYPRPSFEPLLHMVDEPRRLKLRLADGVWVRPVDVAAALKARRYRTPGRLVIQVHDDFCPWNAGRYRLEAAEDGVACGTTGAEPDLVLGPSEIGAMYLGGTSAWTLARAGRISEATPGAVERADAMFGWTPAPWCPQEF